MSPQCVRKTAAVAPLGDVFNFVGYCTIAKRKAGLCEASQVGAERQFTQKILFIHHQAICNDHIFHPFQKFCTEFGLFQFPLGCCDLGVFGIKCLKIGGECQQGFVEPVAVEIYFAQVKVFQGKFVAGFEEKRYGLIVVLQFHGTEARAEIVQIGFRFGFQQLFVGIESLSIFFCFE